MRLMMTALAVCVGVTTASATEYSCPQIRLVVPFASASPGDIAARMVAERLNVRMKRNVVIENHGGATGNIGTKLVVDAAPDGCTLLLNVTAIATFPMSFVNLRYNPFEDLTPVGGIGGLEELGHRTPPFDAAGRSVEGDPSSRSDSASTRATGGFHENTPHGWPSTRGVSGPHMPRRYR